MVWLAGVDGCRGGWFRVCRERGTGSIRFAVLDSVEAILETDPVPEIVALDMPIGLPAAGARACDVAARRQLGPRRSSVFPAPIREALTAQTRAEADAITRRVDGRGVAAQAWGIYAKVAEVDRVLQTLPEARAALREVHPELSFCKWNAGEPMQANKKTPGGRGEREALAEAWLGKGILERARGAHLKGTLADDDILDAIATLWTAHRIAAGTAQTLPADPPLDAIGLPMQIVY